tara:strand:- start:4131 stop:4343 length:213 start_codon:yes stop_codon:yes gene_type:complete
MIELEANVKQVVFKAPKEAGGDTEVDVKLEGLNLPEEEADLLRARVGQPFRITLTPMQGAMSPFLEQTST